MGSTNMGEEVQIETILRSCVNSCARNAWRNPTHTSHTVDDDI